MDFAATHFSCSFVCFANPRFSEILFLFVSSHKRGHRSEEASPIDFAKKLCFPLLLSHILDHKRGVVMRIFWQNGPLADTPI